MDLEDSAIKATQSSTGTGQEQSLPDSRGRQVDTEEGSPGRADLDADRDEQVGTNTDGADEEAVDMGRAKLAAPDTNRPGHDDVYAGKDGVDNANPDTDRSKPEPPNTKEAVQIDLDTVKDGQAGTTTDKYEVDKADTVAGRTRAKQKNRDTSKEDMANKGCPKSGKASQGSGMQLRRRSKIQVLGCP